MAIREQYLLSPSAYRIPPKTVETDSIFKYIIFNRFDRIPNKRDFQKLLRTYFQNDNRSCFECKIIINLSQNLTVFGRWDLRD